MNDPHVRITVRVPAALRHRLEALSKTMKKARPRRRMDLSQALRLCAELGLNAAEARAREEITGPQEDRSNV